MVWPFQDKATPFANQHLVADLAAGVLSGHTKCAAAATVAHWLASAGFTPLAEPEAQDRFITDVIHAETTWHGMQTTPEASRTPPLGPAGEAHQASYNAMLREHNHMISMSPEHRRVTGQKAADDKALFAQKLAFELRDRLISQEARIWGHADDDTQIFYAPFVTEGHWPTNGQTSITGMICAVSRAPRDDHQSSSQYYDQLADIFHTAELRHHILGHPDARAPRSGEWRWEFRRPTAQSDFHVDGLFVQPGRHRSERFYRAKVWARRPDETHSQPLQAYVFAGHIQNLAGA